MQWIENWYPSPCVLDATRSPIYDVFACKLDGSFLVDDMGLPRKSVMEELHGEWICLLGPYYTRQAMLDAQALFDDGSKTAKFLNCAYCTTMMVVFDHAWIGQIALKTARRSPLSLSVAPYHARQGFLCATTLAKYDAPYIVEWMEYHQKLGVEHFYIYNNGSEAITAALAQLVAKGTVTEIPWPHPYRVYEYQWYPWWPNDSHLYCQPPQMMHAIRKYGHGWSWMALIDCDEFLVPATDMSLLDVLRAENPAEVAGVSIVGQWFGNNHRHGPPEGSILETYRRRECGYSSAPKVIASPRNVQSSLIHWVSSAKPIRDLPPTLLSFNHYAAVSAHHSRWTAQYDRDHNDVTDTRILEVRDG